MSSFVSLKPIICDSRYDNPVMECIISNKEDYKFLLKFLLVPYCAGLMIIYDKSGLDLGFFSLGILGGFGFFALYFYSRKTSIDIGYGNDGIYFLLLDNGVRSTYLVLKWSSILSIEVNKRCTFIKTKWFLKDYLDHSSDQYELLKERGFVEVNMPFDKFFTIRVGNSSSFINPWVKIKRETYQLIG